MKNKETKLTDSEIETLNKYMVESQSLDKKNVLVNQPGLILVQDGIGRMFSVERDIRDGTHYLKWLDKDVLIK